MAIRRSSAHQVEVVDYFRIAMADRPGAGAKLLAGLRAAGVGLRAVHAFPRGRGSQVDLVAANAAALRRAARKAGVRLRAPKKAFLVEGADRTGALASLLAPLAEARINVTAASATRAGKGRFGAILWVAPGDVARAKKALGVRKR
jgi:hypothetical protein